MTALESFLDEFLDAREVDRADLPVEHLGAAIAGFASRAEAHDQAVLAFFDERPELARLGVLDAPAIGPAALARRT